MKYADSYCRYTETYENGEHIYIFTGYCVVTGKSQTVIVKGHELHAYRSGKLIQDAMPSLSVSDREFLMSGISAEGWDKMWADNESD